MLTQLKDVACVYCGSNDDVRVCTKCGLVRAIIVQSLTGDKTRAKIEAVKAFTFCANCRVYHEDESKAHGRHHA